jgi:AraC-like DNA-binding protein
MSSIIHPSNKVSFAIHQIPASERAAIVDLIKKTIATAYATNHLVEKISDLCFLIESRLPVSFETAQSLFIDSEGISIAQYLATVRVNKIKELLVYSHFPLHHIVQLLQYADVDTMADELLQQTGLTIDFFLQIRQRKAICSLVVAEVRCN